MIFFFIHFLAKPDKRWLNERLRGRSLARNADEMGDMIGDEMVEDLGLKIDREICQDTNMSSWIDLLEEVNIRSLLKDRAGMSCG